MYDDHELNPFARTQAGTLLLPRFLATLRLRVVARRRRGFARTACVAPLMSQYRLRCGFAIVTPLSKVVSHPRARTTHTFRALPPPRDE